LRLEHVGLALPDPIAAAAWYGRHLGWRTIRASSSPPYAHFLRPPDGGTVIEFFNDPAVADADLWKVHAMQGHLAFAVDDLDSQCERLVSAGAVVDSPLASTPAGDRYVMLRDPWGVPLQLITRVVELDGARGEGDERS
jgi:catechol 2,3-dioxygenase-like lactoylglutathione lyase family enzyme